MANNPIDAIRNYRNWTIISSLSAVAFAALYKAVEPLAQNPNNLGANFFMYLGEGGLIVMGSWAAYNFLRSEVARRQNNLV
jgi:hypothetical protein